MSTLKLAAIFLAVIAVLWLGQEVFVPIVLSALMAMLLAGPVRRMERLRIPRVLAVSIAVTVAFGAVVLVAYLVGNQVYTLASDLDKYQEELIRKVQVVRGTGPSALDKLEVTMEKVEQATMSEPSTSPSTGPASPTTEPTTQPSVTVVRGAVIVRPDTVPVVKAVDDDDEKAGTPDGTRKDPIYAYIMPGQPSPLRTLGGYIGLALPPLATAGLVIVFVFFILLEREDIRDRAIRLVSHGQYTLTTTAVDDAVDRIIRYIRAQAIVNGTYGLAVAIGLWLIGWTLGNGTAFPSVLLWGLLAAVLRFVPYIGPWIAAAFPMVLSIAVYDGFSVFLAVLIMFVIIELASNNIMEPILYGQTTGLSVMAILVAAVFWTWLWGPIGLLLATPLTVVLMVAGRHVPGLGFLEILLGDRPAMMPSERVYQRLLAGDEDEALEVTESVVDEQGVKKAFDDILLPALSMAENDAAKGLLKDDRRQLVMQGTRRIIEEVATGTDATAKTDEPAKDGDKNNGKAATRAADATAAPDAPRVRVAVLPAHDEADEIAGAMLCRLLDDSGFETLHLTQHALASEMVNSVREFDPHLVFVSSMPPAAVSHVRYLLRRVRGGLPVEKLAIGVWAATSELETLRQRLELKTAPIARSLTEAVEKIRQMTEDARISLRKQSETVPAV